MAAKAISQLEPAELAAALGEALLLGASADGLFVCDDDGRVAFADRPGAAFLGATQARARRQDLKSLLGAADAESLELRLESALRDGSAVEFTTGRPGGDDEWVEVRGLPLAGGMAFLLKDVTDRERSERLLRRKEQRLRSANESLRLAHKAARAATWEWRGGALRWLDLAAARALVGLPAEVAEDETISDWRSFVVPDDWASVATALKGLSTTDEAVFEYRVAGTGGHRWMRSSAAVVERRPDGEPARVSGVTLDVTPQKLDEARLQREIQERLRAEERQQLLIHELNHRVKNMLATVQSVARQSLGRARGGGPLADFEDRLMALAWTHDILTRERWAGASITTILARTLAPHAKAARVALEGPDVRLSPKVALALAMGVHELATNAVKYGALSGEAGRVSIRWSLDHGRLALDWRESGGPPVVAPASRGFGSRLLERGLAHELGGEVKLSFHPAGVCCTIAAPFPEARDETQPPGGETRAVRRPRPTEPGTRGPPA